MSELQFHFNPLSPQPSGDGKFPWLWIAVALGVFAIAALYAKETLNNENGTEHDARQDA